MKRGFLLSKNDSAQSNRSSAQLSTKAASTSTQAPSDANLRPPPGWHDSPKDSPSTLHWCFLPAGGGASNARTALLVTERTRNLLQRTRPAENLPQSPLYDIRQIPKKGLGVIATRDLPRDTLVMLDAPILIYEASDRGLGGSKRNEADQIFRYALSRLDPDTQKRFNDLSNAFAGSETYLGRVETNAAPIISFEAAGPAADAVTYSGVFPSFSRLNHACDANARPEWDWERLCVGVKTTRMVKAGEEICVSYIVPFQKRRERQEELMVKVSVSRGERFVPTENTESFCSHSGASFANVDGALSTMKRARRRTLRERRWQLRFSNNGTHRMASDDTRIRIGSRISDRAEYGQFDFISLESILTG